jgi:predicted regulator of Ras-like GTPase activity (Roadblock/LC7/MglB family)
VRRILKQLNDVVGVKGSLVVTKDGMPIASDVSRQLDEELVAAMAAEVIRSARKALHQSPMRDFSRFTLVATHGKMVFTDTGPAFLVVIIDRTVGLGPVHIEIESAAMRIRHKGEIRV